MRCFFIAALALALACTSARPRVSLQAVTVSETVARTQQQVRVVVRRASIEVEVETIAPAVERATRLADVFEGYVENATTREDKSAQVILRVPAARLGEALDSIALLGKVTNRSLSAQDVTEQSVDLEARVTSFRAAREKLRELLNRATTVADAVAAQAELTRVQAELDSLEGQLKALQSSVALSQLSITLNRRIVLGPLGVVGKALGEVIGKLFIWR